MFVVLKTKILRTFQESRSIDDIETINLELILADLESVDKRIERVAKLARQKDKEAVYEHEILVRLKEAFEEENQLVLLNLQKSR